MGGFGKLGLCSWVTTGYVHSSGDKQKGPAGYGAHEGDRPLLGLVLANATIMDARIGAVDEPDCYEGGQEEKNSM